MNTQDAKRVLETALICAHQPMPMRDMRTLFAEEIGPDTVRALLDELVRDWEGRGVELVPLATGWRFQSRPEMREYLDRLNPEKPPKLTHFEGTDLVIEHVEKYWCPSFTSSDITGRPPFHFKDDKRQK